MEGMKTPGKNEELDSQEKNIFNNITIEKDKKTYKLSISKIDKEIIIKSTSQLHLVIVMM